MASSNSSGVAEVPAGYPAPNKAHNVSPPIAIRVAGVPRKSELRIPGESERPCFVVVDKTQGCGSDKYRDGVWYFYIKQNRSNKEGDELAEFWVCSPLYLEAVTTDAHHGNYGRLLRFKTTNGHTRTWAMPMALLRGDCSDIRGSLLSMGVEISTRYRDALSAYLQESTPQRRVQCTGLTGWSGPDYRAFVLPDKVIGPNADNIVFQSDSLLEQEYTCSGNLEEWQSGVSALAIGNPVLAISLCAAFCGPILALCNMESGGIHLIGDSSSGKTTALLAGCSVWGGPGFRRSWRATGNGLEGVAALFNDTLLALDEISECDPRAVSEIVYMLGNGRGKQRANKHGNPRNVTSWRSSVLSTGERSIATTMEEGGYRIKSGQTVRLLDIAVERSHGAWDNLHCFENGQSFSDALKLQSALHYGHAGRQFLQKLTHAPCGEYFARLKEIQALLAPRYLSRGGQVERVLSRFSALALAGELATEFGITQWPKGEAIAAARIGFESWLHMRGQEMGNSEEGQIIDAVTTFIDRHGNSRFSNLADNLETAYTPTRDRAGYWSDSDGERTYLFTSYGMREALKGFDFKRALVVLQTSKMIDPPDSQGKHARLKRIDGVQTRVYVVHPARRWEFFNDTPLKIVKEDAF